MKRTSAAGKLLAKLESASKNESVTIDGEKYSSYGEYVEELDMLVEDEDAHEFEKILEKYWNPNMTYDEPIMEMVDSLSPSTIKELIDELMDLDYEDPDEDEED